MPTCPPLERRPGAGVPGPVLAVIMDGIGVGRGDAGDAVAQAHTPNLDRYRRLPLSTQLEAHGRAVGMPNVDDMGNSEVGHNALGAGRVFDQGAKRVAAAVASGDLFRTPLWQQLEARGAATGGTLHFIGLLSDGNVHSHIDHLLAMLRRADGAGVRRVRLHVMLDGRDVARTSAQDYLQRLEAVLGDINAGAQRDYQIASGGGRMQITMDRYGAEWPMVARGWDLHVRGVGRAFPSALAALAALRAEHPGIGDQDLPGFVVAAAGRPVGQIVAGDGVVAFNFRGDRMLELVEAFESEDFNAFARGPRPDVLFAGMTLYDGDAARPRQFLVQPPQIEDTLGELLCAAGVSQFACSETQKFGHVTYFWNGNRSLPFSPRLEEYVEVPSLPPPFDAQPAMRATEIVAAVAAALGRRPFGCGRINLANGDMVGHTGNLAATIAAVAAVDQALGALEALILPLGGALLITADHGNAEDMLERDRQGLWQPKTRHSTNPVPLHIVLPPTLAPRFVAARPPQPGLANVAATLAVLLGFGPPPSYLPPLVSQLA